MLSIVIPAYNEGRRLNTTLRSLNDYQVVHACIDECILVDDGSEDDTAQIGGEFARANDWFQLYSIPHNLGKGGATRAGVLKAHGDYIFFMDADLSASLDNLLPAISLLDQHADIVIGSRTLKGADITRAQPAGRQLVAWLGNRLIRQFTGLRYRDTQCGFKGFRREVAQALFSELNTCGYLFDVELLVRADHRGFKVAELPVKWAHQPAGSFRVSSNIIKILQDLGRINRDLT